MGWVGEGEDDACGLDEGCGAGFLDEEGDGGGLDLMCLVVVDELDGWRLVEMELGALVWVAVVWVEKTDNDGVKGVFPVRLCHVGGL